MVKMSDKSRAFLEKYLPEVAQADEPHDILGPLDSLIVRKGILPGYTHYNDFGAEAQRVYDDIFDSNFDD